MHISASVRPAPAVAPPAHAVPAPPLRLRFVLLLAVVALAISSLYPRVQAAFRLHDGAVAVANYALCMVGPTGPTLIRDRPREFQQLVRRRLIATEASARPFGRCAKLARSVTGSIEVERAHALTAAEFSEYSGRGTSVTGLGVSAAPLAQLARDAWPFARQGYTQLMKPSLGAAEAAHVPAPPKPALGRGLPARSSVYRNVWRDGNGYGLALGSGSDSALFVTSDRGVNFRPLARRGDVVELHAERCESQTGRKVYRVSPREDGGAQQVLFSLEAGPAMTSELAPISERIWGTACDERSLLALTADRERLHLRVCPFGGRCGEQLLPPAFAGATPAVVDIAKLKGTVVLSLVQEGVVRIVSSRDEGRTFTPAVVAFDAAEYTELVTGRRPPGRLLALGERLILYGGASKSADAYLLLASDDQGVSFRTP
jgi:hypothetical protein